MLSEIRLRRAHRARRIRNATNAGIALLVIAAAVSGILMLRSAQASAPLPITSTTTAPLTTPTTTTTSPAPTQPTSPASEVGADAGDAALGIRIPYFTPPASTDFYAPASIITFDQDSPDPFLTYQDGNDYLFTSQGMNVANIPVSWARSGAKQSELSDALPNLPPWSVGGGTSAPDVQRFGQHYILYFTALVASSKRPIECIGDAYGKNITGPYVPSATPFICQKTLGGSIDPRTFIDSDGTPYLLWKSDENSDVDGTSHTRIYSQQLSADGQQLLGQPTRIFAPDEAWQGRIVESPDLVEVHGAYYLFYSGNWFNQDDYAIGVATCTGPLGPCADTSSTPLVSSNLQGNGPGEPSLMEDPNGIWLVYTPFHSNIPYDGALRPVAVVRLGFGPNGPYLAAPGPAGPPG